MGDVPEGEHHSAVTLAIVPKASEPGSDVEPHPSVIPPATDADDSMAFLWAAVPIVAIVFVTATLDRGRDVLLPIAVAFILAIIFTRLANLLEPLVGRILSAALVVLFALGTITAIGYFLTVELTSVADQVANYSDNIGNKVAALEQTSPPWLQHLKYALANVQRHVQKNNPPAALPRAVEAVPVPPSVLEEVQPILPMLSGVVEALLISVLVFFLLYSRKDLRDRFVRLVARARITIAPQAIETAAQTVGHYLLLFSMINLGFGLFCGLAAWVFGLPNAVLWGLLAFLLRFIPYVGAAIASFLPALVAFAVFPGWSRSLEVVGSFMFLDQIAGQFIEPFVIGPGIDVSPVALLISAMYWSWLWGLPGLLLATPLTACLKVAGDSIPALGFLSVLLGGDRKLEDYHDFYRMLLELDGTGARELAIRFCDEHGLERTFDDVLIPVLVLSGEERAENHISADNQQFILDTVRELVQDLGNRFVKPRTVGRLRILGMCAPGDVHDLGLLMILELLRHAGAAAKLVDASQTPDQIRVFVKSFMPQLVCVSCTMNETVPAAVDLITALKEDSPNLTIFGGGRAALWEASKLLAAGCAEVCGSREETRRAIRRFAVKRSRATLAGTALRA
jgi:predicted PurR-regulated permease PerM/methylmalonyl-CoA mutase cobalamin-binding subunit